MKPIKLFFLSAFLIFVLVACGGSAATQAPVVTEPASTEVPVVTEPVSTEAPSEVTAPPQESTLEEQMDQIESVLRRTLRASIAYNKPQSMTLDQTVTIELLLNPSLSPQVLGTQVSEAGEVVGTSIQITPRTKAVLVAYDDTAFSIKPIHNDPEQIISKTETTRWAWLVSARKGGTQQLTLIVYRLVSYDGQNYWREVETYESDINIEVTFVQRIKSLDWGWFIGIFVTAIAVPAFWRWMDQRKKQAEQKVPPKSRKKK